MYYEISKLLYFLVTSQMTNFPFLWSHFMDQSCSSTARIVTRLLMDSLGMTHSHTHYQMIITMSSRQQFSYLSSADHLSSYLYRRSCMLLKIPSAHNSGKPCCFLPKHYRLVFILLFLSKLKFSLFYSGSKLIKYGCVFGSGFPGIKIAYSDTTENVSVTVKAQSGNVFLALSPIMKLQQSSADVLSVSKGGKTGKDLILEGTIEAINGALQFLQYLGY